MIMRCGSYKRKANPSSALLTNPLPKWLVVMATSKGVDRRRRNPKGVDAIIPVPDLKIAWGSDETQWKITLNDEKLWVAEAIKVMWLEVKATYKNVTPGKKYQIGFKISKKGSSFGWDECPVFLMAKIGAAGSYSWRTLYVEKEMEVGKEYELPANFEIEVPITTQEDTSLEFGLYEVWSGRWKGGLTIHHAFVREVSKP